MGDGLTSFSNKFGLKIIELPRHVTDQDSRHMSETVDVGLGPVKLNPGGFWDELGSIECQKQEKRQLTSTGMPYIHFELNGKWSILICRCR